MAAEEIIQRYRRWYGRLLRLYPARHRQRFGEGMRQTFTDLLREHAANNKNLFRFALPLFMETTTGMLRENTMHLYAQHKPIFRLALVTGLLLLIPLTAKLLVNLNWTLFDFVAAGVMIFGSGLTWLLVARQADNKLYRRAVALTVATALVITWLNGAVGIIGGENNPINDLYFTVLVVGFVFAALGRLRPRAMAIALCAMAVALMSIPILAVTLNPPHVFSTGTLIFLIRIFTLNAFFATLYLIAAAMFRRSITPPAAPAPAV